jgi:predicted nucleotidyltransferase
MRNVAPSLMPVFRSRVQAEILAATLLQPDTEHTLTALAQRAGAALSTVHAEIGRLVKAGVLNERSVGRSRLVRANAGNPAVAPLTELVMLTFGPPRIVAEELADVPGVFRVLLYGSWAARYRGEDGPPPNDIDVLVVGRADRAQVYDAADRAERRLHSPVHPVLVTPERFAKSTDPLLRQIAASPSVTVLDREVDA